MDDLFLSKRIFIDGEFIDGGILVTPQGKIRQILQTQEEVNTWIYSNETNEVSFFLFLTYFFYVLFFLFAMTAIIKC